MSTGTAGQPMQPDGQAQLEFAEFAPVIHSERLTMVLFSFENQAHLDYLKTIASIRSKEFKTSDIVGVEYFRNRWTRSIVHSNWLHGRKAPCPALYAIHLGKNSPQGPTIGLITLNSRVPHLAPDLGFGLTEEYRKQGYASEAVGAVARYWMNDFGLKGMALLTYPSNTAAMKVAEKVGFQRQSQLVKSAGDSIPEDLAWGVLYLMPGTEPFPENTELNYY